MSRAFAMRAEATRKCGENRLTFVDPRSAYRNLIQNYFTRQAVARYEDVFRELTRQRIRELIAGGEPCVPAGCGHRDVRPCPEPSSARRAASGASWGRHCRGEEGIPMKPPAEGRLDAAMAISARLSMRRPS